MCKHSQDEQDEYEGVFSHFPEKRRAAKEHRCGECKTIIAKGQSYIYQAGKGIDDRRPWDFKMCLKCDELWTKFREEREDTNHIHLRNEFCDCLGFLFEQIKEALAIKNLLCWEFVYGLVQEGFFTVDKICPGAVFEREADPRQLQLEFA